MRVLFDLFSGEPNPEWSVGPPLADDLLAAIAENRSSISLPDRVAPILGFRGIEIELEVEEASRYGLPTHFRVADGPEGEKGPLLARSLLDALLAAGAPSVQWSRGTRLTNEIGALLREHIGPVPWPESIEEGPPSDTPAGVDVPMQDGPIRYEALGWDPNKWNVWPTQQQNNCYCYGADKVPGYFAVPGYGSGSPVSPPFTCAEVTAAALRDGMALQNHGQPAKGRNRNLIALVLGLIQGNKYYDFHWYRQLADGSWGHKPGSLPAVRTDDDGKIIWDPKTCARKNYPLFCGYFYTHDHSQVSGWYPGIQSIKEVVRTMAIGKASDVISNVKVASKKVKFDYALSKEPYYQWWALYRGGMRDYSYWNSHQAYDYFYNNDEKNKTGTIAVDYELTSGWLYTIALFKDEEKSEFALADYVEFIG